MSELALYVVATIVVLAGVAYFFVKQREQEALSQRKPQRATKQKAKKETKEPKEPRENKPKKPRTEKKEAEAPTSSKKKGKEEDETKNVLDFLKGKKFSSEKTESTIQAKVRSAPPTKVAQAAPKKKAAVESDSDSGSDNEEYEKVKRRIKTSNNKDKPEEEVEESQEKTKKKPKFFTKQEKDEYEAGFKEARAAREAAKAQREAFKNMTPAEKKKFRAEQAKENGGFEEARQRRPRKERAEGETATEEDESDGRRKYPAREPDQAPVFANEYETADMDNILNNLTKYYNAHPEAGRSKPKAKKQAAVEDSKAEIDE